MDKGHIKWNPHFHHLFTYQLLGKHGQVSLLFATTVPDPHIEMHNLTSHIRTKQPTVNHENDLQFAFAFV